MTTQKLSEQLAALVKTVDGVVQLYDARPTALAAAADLVATVIGQPAGEPIAVTTSGGSIGLAVSVAISDARPAAAVCESILEALSGHLDSMADGTTLDRVTVQVSRIGSDERAGAPAPSLFTRTQHGPG